MTPSSVAPADGDLDGKAPASAFRLSSVRSKSQSPTRSERIPGTLCRSASMNQIDGFANWVVDYSIDDEEEQLKQPSVTSGSSSIVLDNSVGKDEPPADNSSVTPTDPSM